MSRKRAQAIKRRRIKAMVRRFSVLTMILVMVCLTCSCGSKLLAKANNETRCDSLESTQTNITQNEVSRMYKSIEVDSGDSLWSIAERYMNPNVYDSVYDYIDEIKEINGLQSDDLNAEGHITIVYYDV